MRTEFPAKIKFAAPDCARCGNAVFKSYRLSLRRMASHQFYCSETCRKLGTKERAIASRAEYFWTKVQRRGAGECWPWLGYRDSNGYGRYGRLLAHRIAFALATGDQASGFAICHSCDSPPCCNPAHLWKGTQADNVADMDNKGRGRRQPRRGELSNKAKLTAEQALYIFNSSEPTKLLADKFGISGTAVGHIKRRKNWAHVTGGRNAP